MTEKSVVKTDHLGTKRWFLNGKLHREDGPAVEYIGGDKFWYLNDRLHREDGPAIEYADGTKYWYINGKRHREDGPAVEWADGDKMWYLHGERYTEEEFNEKTKGNRNMISFKENRNSLKNLQVTIDALETIDNLISYYEDKLLGRAFIQIRNTLVGEPILQLDAKIMVNALKAQKQVIADHLASLGIDVNS